MLTSVARRGQARTIIGLAMVSLASFHCGGPFPMYDSSSAPDDAMIAGGNPEPLLGEIVELPVASGEIALPIEPADSAEDAVLLLVGLNGGGNDQGFTITRDEAVPLVAKPAKKPPALRSPGPPGDLHRLLRRAEREIPRDARIPVGALRPLSRLAPGETREFNVLKNFGETPAYATVTGRLFYAGEHYDLYVDARDESSYEDEDLAGIAGEFDGVVPLERELFGAESDVDGDGRFAVLLTREINRLGAMYGGVVTGYFHAVDLFSRDEYPRSNEMEVFYGLVPDPGSEFGPSIPYGLAVNNILPGVLPHEFQHMISFNRHRLVSGSATEAPWLNEGLSHLAEDLVTGEGTDELFSSAPENPSRAARYLEDVSSVCLTCGASLKERGGIYLFLRYLYEQAEGGGLPSPARGSEFVAELTRGDIRGLANLTRSIAGDPEDTEAFEEALGHFGLALYFSGSGTEEDERLVLEGLDLRGGQDDGRGTVLDGPAVGEIASLPFAGTLPGHALGYFRLPAELLADGAGEPVVKTAEGARFRAYLIR